MSTSDSLPSLEFTSDAELVAACLAGDRKAFGLIVERYQFLLIVPGIWPAEQVFANDPRIAPETGVLTTDRAFPCPRVCHLSSQGPT